MREVSETSEESKVIDLAKTEQGFNGNEPIYVLRTTQQNQVQLNLMADQKANIIIGISLIFFTIAHRQFVAGIGENPLLIIPLLMLIVTMLSSFVFAILVVAPRIKALRPCSPEDLPNPLFFGFFPAVSEDEFVDFFSHRFRDLEQVRETFLRDIYQTGTVLRRKYRFLRFAYILFSTGVLTSGIATIWLLLDSAGG